MRHDIAAVRALVRQGDDVNAAQGDGMTALHWAATHGDAELAEVLLYAGANVRATSRLGRYTPLHVASETGAAAVVRLLLARGADATAATSTGATALMLAARSGQVEAVTALLDARADVNAVEATHGQTALMFAAAADRAEVVRLLLSRGAHGRPDVEGRGPGGAHRSGRRRRPSPRAAERPGCANPGWRRHGRAAAPNRARRRRRRHPAVPLQRADRHPGRLVGAALRRPAGRRRLGTGAGRGRGQRQPAESRRPDYGAAGRDAQRPLRSGQVPARARRRADAGQRRRGHAVVRRAERAVGAQGGLPAAARLPAAADHLPGVDDAAARSRRRSERAAGPQGAGTRATTSISRAWTKSAPRRSGAPPTPAT